MRSENAPEILLPLLKRWVARDKRFFLNPETLFTYQGRRVSYMNDGRIPRRPGTWYAAHKAGFPAPDLSNDDRQEIARQLLEGWKPSSWGLGLDYRCNYACSMCPYQGDGYVGDYWAERRSMRRSVPKETAFAWLDDLAANGIKNVCLTTSGELFLYPHWREVARYAHALGLSMGTITNGSLVTEELCREMRDCGFSWVNVSLDAVSPEVYAKVRSPKKEHFAAAMAAPLLFKKHGMKVQVHFVEQEANAGEKDGFVTMWKDRGVTVSYGKQIVYRDDSASQADGELFRIGWSPSICASCLSFCTMENGIVAGCCQVQAYVTDDDVYGLGLPSMEEGVSAVIEKLKERYFFGRNVRKYCPGCPQFALRSVAVSVSDGYRRREVGSTVVYKPV